MTLDKNLQLTSPSRTINAKIHVKADTIVSSQENICAQINLVRCAGLVPCSYIGCRLADTFVRMSRKKSGTIGTPGNFDFRQYSFSDLQAGEKKSRHVIEKGTISPEQGQTPNICFSQLASRPQLQRNAALCSIN
jgi:hypothetical protein